MPSTSSALARPKAAKLAVNGGTPVSDEIVPMIAVRMHEDDVNSAVDVLRSGMLAQGKQALAFEERFASMSDAAHAACCANGTCALQLAYNALIEPGDDVLVPAWSYVATASMVLARGARPVWVDADPVTYTIDVADAAAKLTPSTTAIAATHLYGNPADIDAVQRLAIDHALAVIYDGAQAHLASYRGRGIGAFGDAVTYSFYPTKNMTTGEGGMVTTNDAPTDALIRSLRSHGEREKYVHERVGFNYRMTDVEAAIGLGQLGRLPDATERRRANARTLDAALAQIPGLHAPTTTDGATHAYHLYAVRIQPEAFVGGPDGDIRADFIEALRAEGIATAVHYPKTLTRQPVFDHPGLEHPPVSDRLASTLLCVPVHQHLTEAQTARVCEALGKVAEALAA